MPVVDLLDKVQELIGSGAAPEAIKCLHQAQSEGH